MADFGAPMSVKTPEDLLGMVPYVLGFHPQDSIVAIFVRADQRIECSARTDIDTPTEALLSELRGVLRGRAIATLIIIGYGPQSARSAVTDLIDALNRDLPVIGELLVSDGQYFCVRRDCGCRASAGVTFDPRANAAAAKAVVDGHVALPSRERFLQQLAPDPAAQAQTDAAITKLPIVLDKQQVTSAMAEAEKGHRLSVEQIAALALALRRGDIRELAWTATDDQVWQRDMWLDVTRRVPERMVVAPAGLAAWCTWRRGEEVLALEALRRAFAVDPRDPVVGLIARLIEARIHPRSFAWPLDADTLGRLRGAL